MKSYFELLRWHRLGISVKGNTITAIIDCKKQQNRAIKRESGDTIIRDGIILLAQQIDDNTFFEVVKIFCFKFQIYILQSIFQILFYVILKIVINIFRGICNNLQLLIIHKQLTNFALITFLTVISLFHH